MKPRILQLGKLSLYSRGGIEKIVYNIHNLFHSKFSVFTICLDNQNLKKKKIFFSKINFNLNSFYFSINYIITAIKLLRKFKYILGHMPNPLCIVLLLMPKKYILFWHADVVNKNLVLNIIYKPVEILLILFAKKIIFTSEEYRKKSYARLFNSSYAIVPLSTERKIIKNKTSSNKKLLSIGRLVDYKNNIFLIKAMSKLPDYQLTIVGDGPNYSKLFNYIKTNDVKNVKILTNINNLDIPNIFYTHDIFCLASNTRAEAFGIVLIEALSYGLPILVGQNFGSGMLSICENKKNGLIFEFEIDDFANKVKKINNKYLNFSKNALMSYLENYTNSSFINNISSEITLAK